MSEFEWLFMIFVSVVVVVAAFIPKTPIRRYPSMPRPPVVSSEMIYSQMQEDLNNFIAGRPSMLENHLPEDVDKGEFAMAAQIFLDQRVKGKTEEEIREFAGDFSKIDWDKELREL